MKPYATPFALPVVLFSIALFAVFPGQLFAAVPQCPCPGDLSGEAFRSGQCHIDCPSGTTGSSSGGGSGFPVNHSAGFSGFGGAGGGTLFTVVGVFGAIVGALIPIAAALALLAFFWGLAMYLFNFGEGKEDVQKKGKNLMIYGLLAIFVIVSIFGITVMLQRTFGIGAIGGLSAPYVEDSAP